MRSYGKKGKMFVIENDLTVRRAMEVIERTRDGLDERSLGSGRPLKGLSNKNTLHHQKKRMDTPNGNNALQFDIFYVIVNIVCDAVFNHLDRSFKNGRIDAKLRTEVTECGFCGREFEEQHLCQGARGIQFETHQ